MSRPRISGQELVRLKNAVVSDFNASDWRELGALTDTLEEVESHPRLLRSLSFGDDDYEGLALTFLRKMIGPNERNATTVQDYINQVCNDVGEDVSSHQKPGRKIVFSPEIFEVPSGGVDESLVALMMPFSAEFNSVDQTIRRAAERTELNCKRADDIWDHSAVMQDVFSLIFRSFIVLCDFTGKNPNVFYEAGIAHALGKHVVPITQHEGDIPFDLRSHRYAKYLNNKEGLVKLEDDLARRFDNLTNGRFRLTF